MWLVVAMSLPLLALRAADLGGESKEEVAVGGPLPEQVWWLSVDPVRRQVDFYPKAIAVRIESCYSQRNPWVASPALTQNVHGDPQT